jgi:opacity protein-like surface antigen
MKKDLSLVAAILACVLCATPAIAEMKGDVHLLLGKKWMDNDWEPVDNPQEYGFGANFGGVDWPVMIAVDLLFSSDDSSASYDYYGYEYGYRFDVDGTEIDVGARKIWDDKGRFHPYLGGGLAYIKQEATITVTFPEILFRQIDQFSFSLDDSGTGFWVNGGVNWAITPKVYLGLDLRYSDADVEYSTEEIQMRQVEPVSMKLNGGGTHAALLFGYRF